MSDQTVTRRSFLHRAGLASTAAYLGAGRAAPADTDGHDTPHLATNQYPWFTFYRRDGRDFNASLDSGLAEVAASGMDGFEPLVTSLEQIDALVPLLKKYGLEMRSLYVNSVLHQREQADASIAEVLAIAEKAKQAGTKIIVTNPSPIRWGGPDNKDDDQLRVQARAMNRLGQQLNALGLVLSYHNHDIELRNAAREFHHMMVGTERKLVTLCLDAHWIYRGSGNSEVALFDVLRLYGPRVTELHLRQSRGGIWTESLCDGDIDYPAVAGYLMKIGVQPHLVIEQAVENESPKTMDAVEAHRKSREYASRVFGG